MTRLQKQPDTGASRLVKIGETDRMKALLSTPLPNAGNEIANGRRIVETKAKPLDDADRIAYAKEWPIIRGPVNIRPDSPK